MEFDDDILIEEIEEEEEVMSEKPIVRAAMRRKQDWKHAKRRKEIVDIKYNNSEHKPLHYYSKNPPINGYSTAPNKTRNKGNRRYISKNYKNNLNWSPHDKRQLDNLSNLDE